jgi:hypothetical protein
MHAVRETVKSVSQLPEDVLPISVLDAVKGAEFWRGIDDVPLTDDIVDSAPSVKKSTQRFFGEVIESSEEVSKFI